MTESPRRSIPALVALGAFAGLLSGLFGIGGGLVLVPMLVMFLHFPHRLAAGTSTTAILPAAVVGSIGYSLQGNVDWLAALLLAVGMIIGAQGGSYLLARVSTRFLRWFFMAFLLVVIVSLWFVVPQRDSTIDITAISGLMLVVTGAGTGVIAGLLGVGGGVVVVPVLMFFFGASDLIAKGTSLAMMVPGSLSGTLGNWRRRNVDLRSALILGGAASVLSPLGSVIATQIPPFWSNVAFSAFLAYALGQIVWKTVRSGK